MEIEYIDETRLMITLDNCVASVFLIPEELVQFADFVTEQVNNPVGKDLCLPDHPRLELSETSISIDYGSLEIVVIYIGSHAMLLELILSPSEALKMCKAIVTDDGDVSKLQNYWCLPSCS